MAGSVICSNTLYNTKQYQPGPRPSPDKNTTTSRYIICLFTPLIQHFLVKNNFTYRKMWDVCQSRVD